MVTWLAIAAGGAIGAPVRAYVDARVMHHWGNDAGWPAGTMVVNVVGSLVLGVLTALTGRSVVPALWASFLATGFCGSLTTFSAVATQSAERIDAGRALDLAVIWSANLIGALVAAWIGLTLAGG